MINTSLDSSIRAGVTAYDKAIPTPEDVDFGGSAFSPADNYADDSTWHGPPTNGGTPPQVMTWKTYLWFWVSVLGHALLAIFAILIFYLSQSHHSDTTFVVMLFMVVAVFLAALFLNFALTHAFHCLINKLSDEIVNSLVSVILDAIYCAITILFSKQSKSDLLLYVHLIAVTYACTFMALLTYIFSKDIGNARTIFTMQALFYTVYYLQQPQLKLDILLYAVTTVVGMTTLIIRSDDPVESINVERINVAFLRIISFTPRVRVPVPVRVRSNNKNFPLRIIVRSIDWIDPVPAEDF